MAKIGGDPNVQFLTGFRTPLCWAVYCDKKEIVRLLLENGASLNIQTKSHRTPVMLSIVDNTKEIFKLLIERESDLSIVSGEGRNALHFASSTSDLFYMSELLKKKPKMEWINQKDLTGKTPLIFALDLYYLEQALELIRYGANLNIPHHNGKQAIDYIIKYKKVELFEAIEERKEELDRRGRALFEGTKLKFQLIQESGD